MRIIADITLIEVSTAGPRARDFRGQAIEIEGEPVTLRQGVDGKVSRGNHPTVVAWYGGSPAEFDGITHVKIAAQGDWVIDATLNTFYGRPAAIPGGVRFWVMAEE